MKTGHVRPGLCPRCPQPPPLLSRKHRRTERGELACPGRGAVRSQAASSWGGPRSVHDDAGRCCGIRLRGGRQAAPSAAAPSSPAAPPPRAAGTRPGLHRTGVGFSTRLPCNPGRRGEKPPSSEFSETLCVCLDVSGRFLQQRLCTTLEPEAWQEDRAELYALVSVAETHKGPAPTERTPPSGMFLSGAKSRSHTNRC